LSRWTGPEQQVAVGQEVAVVDSLVRLPRMAHPAFHVYETGVMAAKVAE
jgi:hypothetical protein